MVGNMGSSLSGLLDGWNGVDPVLEQDGRSRSLAVSIRVRRRAPWLSKDVDVIHRVAAKDVDLELRHLVRQGSARMSPMVGANCRQKMFGSPPMGIPRR